MMKAWNFILLGLMVCSGIFAQPAENQIVITTNHPLVKIEKDIYGHFSEHLGRCIYDGIWVGEDSRIPNTRGIRNDIVKALKEIGIPNLRWPGGCFAETYHWKDGIGPKESRPAIVNTYWGGVTEDNSFGTHEFMDLVEMLGCDAFICGNLGSGTVQEMAEWVEYLTSDAKSPMTDLRKKNGRDEPWKVKYFGLGNENWACGGNMDPDFYYDQIKRYQTFTNLHGRNKIVNVACGPAGDDYNWTEVMMKPHGPRPYLPFDALGLHYYTFIQSVAVDNDEWGWFSTFRDNYNLDNVITGHVNIMKRYEPKGGVALVVDEWGNWYNPEPGTNPSFLYQQNTIRDAISTAIGLNIFNKHAERVKMANLAQTVNVLQALILTEGDKMILTPTYYTYKMFKVHHDAYLLPMDLKCENYTIKYQNIKDVSIPAISASASVNKDGVVHITLANVKPNDMISIRCYLVGSPFTKVTGEVLTAPDVTSHNSFENPDMVKPEPFKDVTLSGNTLTIHMPAKSVVMLSLRK